MRSVLLAILLTGCRVGLGPTIGYSVDEQKLTAGWETSGTAYIFAGASAGQRFRMTVDGKVDTLSYATLDPSWYVIGATVGGGYSTGRGVVPVLGAWTAGGYWFPGLKTRVEAGNFLLLPYWSVALGYRYTAPGMELYLAPKINLGDPLMRDESAGVVP